MSLGRQYMTIGTFRNDAGAKYNVYASSTSPPVFTPENTGDMALSPGGIWTWSGAAWTLPGAPVAATYLVQTADGTLSNERVVTDTSWISWDWATASQGKANLADAGLVSLAGQDTAAGLLYVSAANTWTSLALAADKGIYATGAGALATYDLTTKARGLLDDATYRAMRNTMSAAPTATEVHVSRAIPFGNDMFVQACQVTGAGASLPGDNADADGYWRRFQTGAVSGNLSTLGLNQATCFPTTGLRLSFIIRTDPAYATNTRLLIGATSAGNPGDVNSANAGTQAMFVKGNTADGDTQFKVCTNDGGGDTGSVSAGFGPTLANDTVYRITFEWTGATTCVVTVEDLDAGTSGSITVTSDMPTTSILCFLTIVTKTSAARYFDFGGCEAQRPFKGVS